MKIQAFVLSVRADMPAPGTMILVGSPLHTIGPGSSEYPTVFPIHYTCLIHKNSSIKNVSIMMTLCEEGGEKEWYIMEYGVAVPGDEKFHIFSGPININVEAPGNYIMRVGLYHGSDVLDLLDYHFICQPTTEEVPNHHSS